MQTNTLKSWLFSKPLTFSIISFLSIIVFVLLYSFVASLISIDLEHNSLITIILSVLPFIYPAYYMIKKLPHDKMLRSDFIAIVNGVSIITLIFSLITVPYFIYAKDLQKNIFQMYYMYPTLFNIATIVFTFIVLYFLGLSLSGIYAKYKRCTTIGISPWKIILSMPFSFFMLWTPGYLIEEKTKKTNLEIKSQWYSNFNKFVLSNFNNTLFVFLFFTLFKSIISGTPSLILTSVLLVIYTLWYVKHKSDFIKDINNGYALTAIGINISILMALAWQYL
nr:hypothetical protein [Candidatus Enterousia merdequi]